MSFKDIALPLIARGIPVIPVQPLEKRCLLPEWQQRCTTETGWIDFWELQDPTYNVGCVAKPNGIVILDCDVKGLAKRIAKETGQTWPRTLVVRSAGKGCYHIYLRQTDRSRELGNRSVPELFDLQQNDKYVVGPGSRIANGNTYDIMQDEQQNRSIGS
jgi:Bifunctional DNA primase/polymerase, N-terminal